MSISASISAGVGSVSNDALPKNPINITAPVLSGTFTSGNTISCSDGAWENNPYIFTYQWYRDSIVIIGAETSTYRLGSDDINKMINCLVIAENDFGKGLKFSNSVNITA